MLILDEVMAGFGRTGEWFAFDAYDVVPDLITFAKGVNSGYVPVGGVVISDPIAAHFDDRVFPGGLTYSGHPLAMASIVASIDAMDRRGHRRQRRARSVATCSAPASPSWPTSTTGRSARSAAPGSSGRSSWSPTPTTREPVARGRDGPRQGALLERGLLPFVADNRIHVVPPCVVTDDEAGAALAIYDDVLTLLTKELS